MKVLVTGGAGFIGSNFIHYLLQKCSDVFIINLDKLTYAGNQDNLANMSIHPRYRFIKGDIADPELVLSIFREGIDAVINFAAESHVDRSIHDPAVFVRTNIIGTQVLLEAALKSWGSDTIGNKNTARFIQVSTDEVYGSLGPKGAFFEESALQPNSPYAASKAGADCIALAYYRTFGLPVAITRCSNNYGPYQFPEKLIPLMITNALEDIPLPVYGDGLYVRDWIYVNDHCSALETVLRKGRPGEIYNIGGSSEKKNIDVVKKILQHLGKPLELIQYVKDRPGHDRRYAINADKIKNELGWAPKYAFGEGLEQTITWYIQNRSWWQKIKSGAYRDYYERQYNN